MLNAPFPTFQPKAAIGGPRRAAISKRDRECAESWLLHYLDLHRVEASQRISITAEVIAAAVSRGDPARFMQHVMSEGRRALTDRRHHFTPPIRRSPMAPPALEYLSWSSIGRGIFERLQGKESLELSFK